MGSNKFNLGATIKWSDFRNFQGLKGLGCVLGWEREVKPVSCCRSGAFSYNERGVSYINQGNGLLSRFQVILQFKFIFSDRSPRLFFSLSNIKTKATNSEKEQVNVVVTWSGGSRLSSVDVILLRSLRLSSTLRPAEKHPGTFHSACPPTTKTSTSPTNSKMAAG